MTTLTTRPLMTLRVAVDPLQELGAAPLGGRSIYPITGGEFEGARLRGKVLPGGGDWMLLRSDGVRELDLRITLETDDKALIYMTFFGLRHAFAPDGSAAKSDYFRTTLRFETAAPKYAFMNRLLAIGSGEIRANGPLHVIEEIL